MYILILKCLSGTSLAVQWLKLCASNAGGMGSIPGRGTKNPHVTHVAKKRKISHKRQKRMEGGLPWWHSG